MIMIAQFNAFADSYEVKSRLSAARNTEGVNNAQLLMKQSGDGQQYCVYLDVEESAVEKLTNTFQSAVREYSGYVSDMKVTVYKPM